MSQHLLWQWTSDRWYRKKPSPWTFATRTFHLSFLYELTQCLIYINRGNSEPPRKSQGCSTRTSDLGGPGSRTTINRNIDQGEYIILYYVYHEAQDIVVQSRLPHTTAATIADRSRTCKSRPYRKDWGICQVPPKKAYRICHRTVFFGFPHPDSCRNGNLLQDSTVCSYRSSSPVDWSAIEGFLCLLNFFYVTNKFSSY